jgi:HEAT repeat protein/energy-coupling factor transporter ATP-binding protein EcfA2
MDPLTGALILGLYKGIERVWDKSLEIAVWEPMDEGVKSRVQRWTGRDQERTRRRAFQAAAAHAREHTISQADAPDQARALLDALDDAQNEQVVAALAQESAKILLLSDEPNLTRLTALARHKLRQETFWQDGQVSAPDPAAVATVLRTFLLNLRDALLDQPPYADLLDRESLRVWREILREMRPLDYDDEAAYRRQLVAHHRELDFIGIPEVKERRPVTVEEIFVRLRTRSQASRQARRLPDEAEISLDLWEGAGPVIIEASQIATRHERAVILGDPGAGKTTLLKYLTLISSDHRAEELGLRADTLPLFIRLRDFAAEQTQAAEAYSLLDYLYHHAHEHLQLNLPPDFFQEALRAGRCLVCLDGLDEVWAAQGRGAVCDQVEALASRYPRNRYLVTSRVVGYEQAPLSARAFRHYTVLPLEDGDVRRFVEQWYQAREPDPIYRASKIKDLLDTFEAEPRIRDLARNPLLLTIIALVHRIEAELPYERVKLYDKCVTALVETWEKVKGLTIEEKTRPFYRHRHRLLERLAYELHRGAEEPGQQMVVKRGDLARMLTGFLMGIKSLGLSGDPETARDEALAFIHLARSRTGLLVERGDGVFGFPHLTFQEYLAACDIHRRLVYRGEAALWDEIKDHLHDAHWREVILLLLGSLNEYEEFPTLLVERILAAGEDDKFEPVLHRCLLFAARTLTDRVDVDAALHQRVVDGLLALVRGGLDWERDDAIQALIELEDSTYACDGLLALACDEHVDAWMRRAATDALVQSGRADDAVEVLLVLVHDKQVNALVRSAAAIALGQLGRADRRVLDSLLSLAHDGQVDAWVRSDAASALGQLGHADECVLDGLLLLAHDEQVDALVRYEAANALGQLGRADEAVQILLVLARDAQVGVWVRRAAASVLGQLGRADEAAEVLLTLTRDEQVDAWVCRAIASVLGQLGRTDEAARVLLALARDEQVDAWVRRAAASALGQLGRADEAAEVLLALAHDEQVDAEVRCTVASALKRLGLTDEAAEVLLILAHDEGVDAWVRCAAASALGRLDRTSEAAQVLLALAHDEQMASGLCRAAAIALGRLGCTDEWVLDGLLALARDERMNDLVRYEAANALGQLDCADEAAEALLALALNEQVDAWARRAAASTLGQLGRAAEAAKVLLTLARDEQVTDGVRRAAARALEQLGRADEQVLAGLLALSRDTQVDPWVRHTTASVLVQLGRADEAVKVLLALIHDEQVDTWVRSDVASTLGQLGRADEQILDGLLTLTCDACTDPWLCRATAYALGQLGCASEKILDSLLTLACDDQMDTRVRDTAAHALKALLGSKW